VGAGRRGHAEKTGGLRSVGAGRLGGRCRNLRAARRLILAPPEGRIGELRGRRHPAVGDSIKTGRAGTDSQGQRHEAGGPKRKRNAGAARSARPDRPLLVRNSTPLRFMAPAFHRKTRQISSCRLSSVANPVSFPARGGFRDINQLPAAYSGKNMPAKATSFFEPSSPGDKPRAGKKNLDSRGQTRLPNGRDKVGRGQHPGGGGIGLGLGGRARARRDWPTSALSGDMVAHGIIPNVVVAHPRIWRRGRRSYAGREHSKQGLERNGARSLHRPQYFQGYLDIRLNAIGGLIRRRKKLAPKIEGGARTRPESRETGAEIGPQGRKT